MLDALEQPLHGRRPNGDKSVIHHSDRGSQYLSIRYSERLAEAGIEPSVGSRGDSYDNALAETINGLYKAEMPSGKAGGLLGERLKGAVSSRAAQGSCILSQSEFHLI